MQRKRCRRCTFRCTTHRDTHIRRTNEHYNIFYSPSDHRKKNDKKMENIVLVASAICLTLFHENRRLILCIITYCICLDITTIPCCSGSTTAYTRQPAFKTKKWSSKEDSLVVRFYEMRKNQREKRYINVAVHGASVLVACCLCAVPSLRPLHKRLCVLCVCECEMDYLYISSSILLFFFLLSAVVIVVATFVEHRRLEANGNGA